MTTLYGMACCPRVLPTGAGAVVELTGLVAAGVGALAGRAAVVSACSDF